jgi:hypothetical protein
MRRMRKRLLSGLALASLVVLPACATANGVRWAYGKDSCYDEPDALSESCALRAIVGAPVIVGGVVWDAVTWPLQIIFGVWPTWGQESTMMEPTH